VEVIESLDVSPDGGELVVTAERDGRREVILVPTHGGEERTLAPGKFAAFDARGHEILFVDAADAQRVLAVSRAGGAPRLVIRAPEPVLGLACGPDDRAHLRTRTGALAVPIAGGEATPEAASPFVQLVPAPAGGWRAAIVDLGHLRVVAPDMAPDDPRAAEITDWRTFAWARDGRSIYYVTAQEIRRFVVESGATEKVLAIGDVTQMVPSPDGKTIYAVSPVAHARRAMVTNYGDRPRP
jgi:hypothetical protein